jgi:UDPglucose 6-dehydrogenase
MSTEKVCVVGSTHLACIHATGIAEFGATVLQCDDNPEIIARLKKADPPLFEPGLVELIEKHQASGGLSFSDDIPASVAQADIVYLAEDIRVENGLPDVSMAHRRFEQIVPHLAPGAIVAVSTQVPVGTLNAYAEEFGPLSVDGRLRLVYQPEFLRLGAAVKLFLSPDYIVLGHNDEEAGRRVMDLYKSVDCPKHFMGLADAEMVKHAANAYVAVSVGFACEMARFADVMGVDAFKVGRALRSDRRIGPTAYVLPGLGFTGGNLERDISVWREKAAAANVPTTLLEAALEVNDAMAQVPLELLTEMLGDVAGKTVAIWGLAYKPDSNSIRGSYAIVLAKGLIQGGAKVRGFDPNVRPEDLAKVAEVELGEDRYAICEEADALAIMNNAKLYSDCDFQRLAATMAGKVILDPHGMVSAEAATSAGFKYGSVGRGYRVKSPTV